MRKVKVCAGVLMLSAACTFGARASVLWDNGGFVTDPTGGTGAIAGQPISTPELVPNSSVPSRTTGVTATAENGIRLAEDFTVPAGQTWDLNNLRVFAFQQSLSGPTVSAVKINIWTSAPFDALSPAPRPDPLPQPMLTQSITASVTSSEFIAYRQLSSGTSSNTRAIYGYDVSLNDLPNGGILGPGTYWLEWSIVGTVVQGSSSQTQVIVPLVAPRDGAPNLNARQYAPANINLDGVLVTTWFESREVRYQLETENGNPVHVGYFDQPMALPFTLDGIVVPEPGMLSVFALGGLLLGRRR